MKGSTRKRKKASVLKLLSYIYLSIELYENLSVAETLIDRVVGNCLVSNRKQTLDSPNM